MTEPANWPTRVPQQTGASHAGLAPERSVVEILKDMAGNIQEIIRGEIRLVKSDLGDQARLLLNRARLLAAGVVLGLFGAAYLLLSGAYALALVMPPWAAAGVVGLTLAIAAMVLVDVGLRRLKSY